MAYTLHNCCRRLGKYFLYGHFRKDSCKLFYVGIGTKQGSSRSKNYQRATAKSRRNPIWKNIINKTAYTVEIVRTNLSKQEAINLEISLIEKYGKIKNKGLLSNISNGGETVLPELLTVLNDPKCSQRVYQYDLEGNFLKEWLSTNQIKRELGFDNSVIRKALTGKTKSPNISYKFQWFLEYKGEKINASDSGKITLHKRVKLTKGDEVLIFNSREECAKYFKVKSYQITNAINKNFKFKKYKVENYEK